MADIETVIFDKIKLAESESGGLYLGSICLNSPRTLNSLSLVMVQQIYQQLSAWQNEQQVVAVFLYGAGEKAFCAGGDIQALYHSITAEQDRYQYADQFFCQEYQLDYLIHTYGKPVICYGHGYVMGGGLGLMAGSSIRVVASKTRLAMPEISIGLFPDVGATWFLNQMPKGVALFVGLTGAQLNARDAQRLGLADFFVAQKSVTEIIETLSQLQWGQNSDENVSRLNNCFNQLQRQDRALLPDSEIEKHDELFSLLAKASSVYDAVKIISSYKVSDPWIERAQKSVAKGCPSSAALLFWQINKGANLNKAQAFQQELIFAGQCCRQGDFAEGVRALIIEKDNQPRWRIASYELLDDNTLTPFFVPPWGQADHPLRNL